MAFISKKGPALEITELLSSIILFTKKMCSSLTVSSGCFPVICNVRCLQDHPGLAQQPDFPTESCPLTSSHLARHQMPVVVSTWCLAASVLTGYKSVVWRACLLSSPEQPSVPPAFLFLLHRNSLICGCGKCDHSQTPVFGFVWACAPLGPLLMFTCVFTGHPGF